MEPTFVHLRLHTEFSVHDGLVRIPSLMERAAQDRMPAVAITDLSNLYATVKFFKACMSAGVKPIFGVDAWIANDDEKKQPTRLTLLCQTDDGYQNLVKLVSKSYLEGQHHGKAIMKKKWFKGLSDGLIALSGSIDGDIGNAIIAGDKRAALKHAAYWSKLFPNRFYLELTRTGKKDEKNYIELAIKLAEKADLPVVATNDVRFLNQDDFEAHEARTCIQGGYILADPNRPKIYTDQQYFRTQAEMEKLFEDIPEALINTVEIAKRCNVSFTLGENKLPHFEVPKKFTTESYLAHVAKIGLDDRLSRTFSSAKEIKEKRKAYDERLERELEVINEMGFPGYFLIVADFVKWAKENGVPVGPGRGSGPGSLVAYSLKITDLDPLALELLFERFLNPERVSMPDFDIDFCMDGRDRVIDYVMNRHGHDSVSQIITYGTMAAKAVVRDVGRVLGNGYGFVDAIAKLIPFEIGMTLSKAMVQEPLLKERYDSEEEVRTLIDLALKLEGATRNVGKHAGGIVIAPGKLTDFVPLYCEEGEPDHPVTQFDKDDVEAVGLVKFDFLGLKTLTIIDRALKDINKHERKVDINLIPFDDEKSFELLKKCHSTAVFQLESHGMRDLIKRLQPDCFEDLIALVALFRPGPLQSGMVDDFIDRKKGIARVDYPHPDLEPILRPTYGVIVYQEQVMQIAQVLAGYTLGAADILRRAMGKKKPEEMAKQRIIFTEGAVKRGVDEKVATGIFDLMEKFAGYGFNKSHSASYALIAYQTAYLKAHYTAEFMAAVLSSDMDKTDKVIIALNECKVQNIEVLPPSINESYYHFKVMSSSQIRYGLGAIKGVGEAVIEDIINTREKGDKFKDLFDFCTRINLKKANKRVFEALIKSGSLDCFNQTRATLLASLPKALQQAEQTLRNETYGQGDLLGLISDPEAEPAYVKATPWTDDVQLQGEKATLGFYLTGHPIDQYLDEIKHFTTGRLSDIHPSKNKNASVAGLITGFRTRQTKRGDRIGIFSLDDGKTQIDVVCFSDAFQKHRHILTEDQLVIVDGEVSIDDFSNKPRIVGRSVCTLSEARERHAKALLISLDAADTLDSLQLQIMLKQYLGGRCPIQLQVIENGVKTNITLGEQWLIKPANDLIETIRTQLQVKDAKYCY